MSRGQEGSNGSRPLQDQPETSLPGTFDSLKEEDGVGAAGILAHFLTPKPDNLGHASEFSVFNSQPQRKDYMMQFLTEITGQGAAHSI